MWQKVKELSTQLAKANSELKNLARLDGLTGIENRRSFDGRAD
jgi:PleD family two-component response regulator